jgi:hypothetical protein
MHERRQQHASRQQLSYFKDFPAEIRNNVYEQLFNGVPAIEPRKGACEILNHIVKSSSSTIHLVDKQIHHKVKHILAAKAVVGRRACRGCRRD